MNCWSIRLLLAAFCLLAFPCSSPAPLIYRPGEGWSYEPVGGEPKWRKTRAKDQLDVAQAAFDQKNYGLALKAARRVLSAWPVSDYAPQAQYLVGRCYEARGNDERAFKEYQKLLDKQPKLANYDEVLQRQFDIANLYLGGKWFKLFGYLPWFPSMERTADMFTKIVHNGPYSDVAPQAQLKVGAARVKQSNYPLAAKAYELAADRYHDRPAIAAEALYQAGQAYHKQAQTAEYDQSTAGQAIATFTDFMALYPNDKRVAETQKTITTLRREQARGSFQTARFYEKYHKWRGAVVYYNEAIRLDPDSPAAAEAQQRIDALNKRIVTPGK